MGWVVNATPRPYSPSERPGTHCIGGWVGAMTGLEGCGKSRPPPGFERRTVQSVASRYTECVFVVLGIYYTTWMGHIFSHYVIKSTVLKNVTEHECVF